MNRQTIFITGAASGIGKETAKLFASKGYYVGLADINEEGLKEVQNEIGEEHASYFICDVTDPTSVEQSIKDFTDKTKGRLDVYHANAGIIYTGDFDKADINFYKELIEVNAFGTVSQAYFALPYLKETKDSTFIITSSASALWGIPGFAVYGATKKFVRGITEALHNEFDPFGIHVTDVMPNFVKTKMMDKINETNKKASASLTAEDIASIILKAVNKRSKIHWFADNQASLLYRLSRILPMKTFSNIIKTQV